MTTFSLIFICRNEIKREVPKKLLDSRYISFCSHCRGKILFYSPWLMINPLNVVTSLSTISVTRIVQNIQMVISAFRSMKNLLGFPNPVDPRAWRWGAVFCFCFCFLWQIIGVIESSHSHFHIFVQDIFWNSGLGGGGKPLYFLLVKITCYIIRHDSTLNAVCTHWH